MTNNRPWELVRLDIDGDTGSETWRIGDLSLERVHSERLCMGRACVIHDPSPHHMRDLPLHWRNDRAIFERICDHGVGHPDPDQYTYWEESGQTWQGVHGCDGCCRDAA